MAKFTLLEVHLDDSTFTANAPFSGGNDDDSIDSDESTDLDESIADEETSGGPSFAPLVVLAVLVVGAIVLRRVLGGDGDDAIEAEDEEIEVASLE